MLPYLPPSTAVSVKEQGCRWGLCLAHPRLGRRSEPESSERSWVACSRWASFNKTDPHEQWVPPPLDDKLGSAIRRQYAPSPGVGQRQAYACSLVSV